MTQPPANIPDYHTPATGKATPSPMLTPEQMQEIQRAKERAKKVLRAATVAKVDGGITAFFAVGALASFFMGIEGFLLGLALSLVAYKSFLGAKRLAQFDRTAPQYLALNQILLAASIILYAAYSLHQGLSGKNDLASQLGTLNDPSANNIAGDIQNIYQLIYWVLYGGLIVGTIVAQGLAALYYGSRAKFVRAYLDETPQWVVDLQRAHAP